MACSANRIEYVDQRFERHNAEQAEVWRAYRDGVPIRPPMVIGCNERITMDDPRTNPDRITFQDLFVDPAKMLQRQLEHQWYVRTHIPQDAEMGLPTDGWSAGVIRFNVFEAAWFGCPVVFEDGLVPDTLPLDEASVKKLLADGVPDPYDQPFMAKVWADYEFLRRSEASGFEYLGRPLRSVGPCAGYTDGPLTVACNVRGATEFLGDLLADPPFADALLDLFTEAAIVRIRAIRERIGAPLRSAGVGFADDSCQLISTDMYVERILPRHKRLIDELGDGSPNGVHMCGNATRHFPTIARELNVGSFDTGFPVDFGALRQSLGPEVEIVGGPSVPFLETHGAKEVYDETRRILESGVTEGGRFILREGNNLPPGVPLDNLWAMYRAVGGGA